MQKTCLIISGGDPSQILLQGSREDVFIIACDRGYIYADQAGIRPDLFVGDFDSYHGDLEAGVPVLELPVEKDDTDTMAAVRYAEDQGYEEIILCCSMGGRFDHAFGNIQSALFAVRAGIRTTIREDGLRIWFVKDETITIPRADGWSLSAFAMTDECIGTSIRGTKYEIEDWVLTNWFPLGVSNEWAGPEAEITVGKGILMVVSARMP